MAKLLKTKYIVNSENNIEFYSIINNEVINLNFGDIVTHIEDGLYEFKNKLYVTLGEDWLIPFSEYRELIINKILNNV